MNTDSKASEVKQEAIEAVTEEKKPGEKKPKKKKLAVKAKKKIPENETEEERKEREKKEEKKKKAKPKDIKAATKRLFAYIAKYKILLVIVAVLVVFTTVTSVIASLFMMPVYQAIEDALEGTVDAPSAFKEIVKWLLVMAACYIVSAACNLVYTRIMLHVSTHTLKNMRRDLFNHIQTLPLEFFDKRKTGEIMSHFTNDVSKVSDLVSNNFPTLISSSIQAVLTIGIMIAMSWKLTLTITVAIVLMFAVVMLITSKCSPLFKKQQKAIAECNGYIEEYIKGIKVVKLFSREANTKAQFSELNENYRKTGVKANIIGGFMGPLMSMITRVNYAIVVFLGAFLVINGSMDVPVLVTYLDKSKSYASPIASLAGCYSSLVAALAGAERIFEVLDTDPETDEGIATLVRLIKNATGETVEANGNEGEFAWKIPEEDGERYIPLKGNIELKDVTFSYVEGTEVLKNIDINAKEGEKIAFVGSTGAGKTTITNLINRFYEIDKGEILYDGIPVKDIKKDDLRRSMAMVLQDTKLFSGTIKDNIRYGKLDATDEEIIAAAKLSNAHYFIEKLPEGYETKIKPDATNISVGQAQLINIARAAVAGAPLLILDEATSSVDTRTERLIEIGMDKLMDNKTVFVIAHRLSTVRNSDNIVVLEKGEIIEEGNHQKLIDDGGKYYQLYTGSFEME
ncbi:MAG: ABC transporter ATP-binding protein [Ruminococcaceae bacterium]|nr:ABC transporter ATP-binding protein [Oscillospiraceae bacterium]